VLEGGGTGEAFPLRPGSTIVGREGGDVAFPADRYVSARHARVDVIGSAVSVSDLGSSNGTFVRVTGPAEISAGDQFLLGMQLLRVET
jgi:pSer/pThr/pTyr-binding forkhead associated (FHA) protein